MTFGHAPRPMFTELFGPLVGLDAEWRAQGAAEAEINPIRVTLPLQGRHLVFKRDLQTKANDEMFLSFQAGSDRTRQFRAPAGIAAALFAALWLLAVLAAPAKRREA